MGRKNNRPKTETFVIPKDLLVQVQKPRYNAHQTGTGVHGDTKYKRQDKHKKDYKNSY